MYAALYHSNYCAHCSSTWWNAEECFHSMIAVRRQHASHRKTCINRFNAHGFQCINEINALLDSQSTCAYLKTFVSLVHCITHLCHNHPHRALILLNLARALTLFSRSPYGPVHANVCCCESFILFFSILDKCSYR